MSFIIQLNGAPVTQKVVIAANAFDNKQFTIVHNQGAEAAGKLLQIETSSLVYISSVNGNLDANGQFVFTVGPSFDARGNVVLTVEVGNKKKTLEVQFV